MRIGRTPNHLHMSSPMSVLECQRYTSSCFRCPGSWTRPFVPTGPLHQWWCPTRCDDNVRHDRSDTPSCAVFLPISCKDNSGVRESTPCLQCMASRDSWIHWNTRPTDKLFWCICLVSILNDQSFHLNKKSTPQSSNSNSFLGFPIIL